MAKKARPWPGFESFVAARFAAYMAYRMAGINDPIEDLDLVETHDAFTISRPPDLRRHRPALYGQEQDYITSGDAYLHNPKRGSGQVPANLSGGLLGTMHAVGATGIFQMRRSALAAPGQVRQVPRRPEDVDAVRQEKPTDWKSLQVEKPRRGLSISHAGVGSHVTCAVLEKAW